MQVLRAKRYTATSKRQKGAFVAVTAILVPVLLGLLGMVLTIGDWYVTRTQLQSAADACALAGATRLGAGDSYDDATIIAIKAARLQPKVGLFNLSDISSDDVNVTFTDNALPNNNWIAAPSSPKGIKCIVKTQAANRLNSFANGLASGVNLPEFFSGTAVAGLLSYRNACITTIGMCAPAVGSSFSYLNTLPEPRIVNSEYGNNSITSIFYDFRNRFVWTEIKPASYPGKYCDNTPTPPESPSFVSFGSTDLFKIDRSLAFAKDMSFQISKDNATAGPWWSNYVSTTTLVVLPLGACGSNPTKGTKAGVVEYKFDFGPEKKSITQNFAPNGDFGCFKFLAETSKGSDKTPNIQYLGPANFGSPCAKGLAIPQSGATGQQVAVLYPE